MEQSMELSQALSLIRDVPDFPQAGILFKDITPLLANGPALTAITEALADSPTQYSCVAGIEARGFIVGSAIAVHRNVGFIPLRKIGKLPFTTIARSYGLEYGSDVIEAHIDAVHPGDQVLIVDDVLATGGTLIAAIEIIEELGASISEVVALFEIEGLGGRERIAARFPHINVRSLVKA
jgi:adenine phosphoribosyltransferase